MRMEVIRWYQSCSFKTRGNPHQNCRNSSSSAKKLKNQLICCQKLVLPNLTRRLKTFTSTNAFRPKIFLKNFFKLVSDLTHKSVLKILLTKPKITEFKIPLQSNKNTKEWVSKPLSRLLGYTQNQILTKFASSLNCKSRVLRQLRLTRCLLARGSSR